MALSAGDRRLGLSTGVTPAGLAVFVPFEGACDPLQAGDRRVGLITGVTSDGKPIVAWGDQKCKAGTSHWEAGKRYIGLVTGVTEDGTPIIASWCEECEETPPVSSCGCEICCTLSATVQVGDGVAGDPWSDAVDVDLTCGGVLETDGGHCCVNDEVEDDIICFKIRNTYSEKNTLGSPEAYVGLGPSSGTREVKTDIWSSGNFTIGTDTYRLSLWRSEGTIYQTSPSEETTPFCVAGWSLQHLHTNHAPFDPYPDFWETVAGNDIASWVASGILQWLFVITDDNPYAPNVCPDGFGYSAGDLTPSTGCNVVSSPYSPGGTSSGDAADCPVLLAAETWYKLNTDPDDDAHRIKCAKVSIADLC